MDAAVNPPRLFNVAVERTADTSRFEFLGWWNKDSTGLSPVPSSAIVHYRFEAIHPFADGNGRTGRAPALWELYRRGFESHRIFSVDEFYREDRPRYYAALQAVRQQGKESFVCSLFLQRRKGCGLELLSVELAARASQVVKNDAYSTALPAAFDGPSQLSHAARTRNDRTGFGMSVQVMPEPRVFVIIEIVNQRLREERRLDGLERRFLLRH